MPNTTQVMSTQRKYLTPSRKSYQQSHKRLDGIRKQINESNGTDYLLPKKETYCRNLKRERRPDCQDKLPDKQILTNFWASIWGNAARHNLKAS
jgi:hypothetical protein